MLNSFSGRHPLHIARHKPTGGTEGVSMIHDAFIVDGNSFETPVRMVGESRHIAAVIHSPAIFGREILSYMTALQLCKVDTEIRVSFRVFIPVVGTEDKWVLCFPWKMTFLK